MILTILVPTYNIENYLADCLDSFAACIGTYAFEVLVVDDGSTDGSAKLAQKYVDRYPSVFRLIRKENGGHGSTINCGLREAKGRYVKVVDGDDWVEKQGFLNLLEVLSTSGSDIVASPYSWVHYETKQKKLDKASVWNGEFEREYAFEEVADQVFIKMHSLTYRTKLLRECGLHLDEHCFYVDLEYDILPIASVRTITFVSENVYMYRIGMSGQSMSLKNMQKNRRQYVRVLRRLFSYYEGCRKGTISCPPANLRYIENALALAYASYFKILLSFPLNRKIGKHMTKIEEWLNIRYPEVYKRISNPAVLILRKSHYLLYPAACMAFMAWKKCRKLS